MAGSVSRRDFFKAGGMAGLAAVWRAWGSGRSSACRRRPWPRPSPSPTLCTPVRCGAKALDYEALVKHFEEEHPDSTSGIPQCATLNINGAELKVQVEPQWTLRETLAEGRGALRRRQEICDRGGCGSCTVLIDGVPALACTTLAVQCEGRQIRDFRGHCRRRALPPPWWSPTAKHDTAQCGYCTPGQFTVAKYIIEKYGEPTGGADPRGAGRQHLPLRHLQPPREGHPEAASAVKGGQLIGERCESILSGVSDDAPTSST